MGSSPMFSTNVISSVWLERLFYTQDVVGSNPALRTRGRSGIDCAQIAYSGDGTGRGFESHRLHQPS